jgi:hypothetical protein
MIGGEIEIEIGIGIGIGIEIEEIDSVTWHEIFTFQTFSILPPPKRSAAHTHAARAPTTADLRSLPLVEIATFDPQTSSENRRFIMKRIGIGIGIGIDRKRGSG